MKIILPHSRHRKQYYGVMINVILNNVYNQTVVGQTSIVFFPTIKCAPATVWLPTFFKYLLLCSAQEDIKGSSPKVKISPRFTHPQRHPRCI